MIRLDRCDVFGFDWFEVMTSKLVLPTVKPWPQEMCQSFFQLSTMLPMVGMR